MARRKWSSARLVRVYLEICLVLGGIAWALLLAYLLFSPWSSTNGADADVVVALGSHSLVPRLPLDLVDGPEVAGSPYLRATLIKGYGELRTVTTDGTAHVLTMLVYVIGIPILLYIFWVLRQFLLAVLDGHPFAPENSPRLRRIGLILMGLTVVVPVAEYWVGQAVLSRLQVETLPLSPALRFSEETFFLGLLFLVFSAVFRYGTELEEDKSLTI